MTEQDVRRFLQARPFQPFRVVMQDGEIHEVPLVGMAFVMRTTLFVGSEMADDGIPSEFRFCPLDGIETIEPIDDFE